VIVLKQAKKNEAVVDEVTFGEGENPGRSRWPFSQLAKGKFFEVTDLKKHVALRTAASRARKKLRRIFAVHKVTKDDGTKVIRVYRQ
jgi:hypothetical protein